MHKLSEAEIEQMAALSAELDNNKVFQSIITTLTAEAIQELLTCEVGGLTAQAAHARMKALNDIKARIKGFQNDAVMMRRRRKQEG